MVESKKPSLSGFDEDVALRTIVEGTATKTGGLLGVKSQRVVAQTTI